MARQGDKGDLAVQETFTVTRLIELYRESLLALIPVMDAAKISWREDAYDPWENIERTIYESIIGSCVANAVGLQSRELVTYGLEDQKIDGRCFLSARSLRLGGKRNSFVDLTHSGPDEAFDQARFEELDNEFRSTGRFTLLPLHGREIDLTVVAEHELLYLAEVTFEL